MGGGTDLFAALLALCSVYNACAMNGAISPPLNPGVGWILIWYRPLSRPAPGPREPHAPLAPRNGAPRNGALHRPRRWEKQDNNLFSVYHLCLWEKI
eukprot:symbB.v1.2.021282.t1/scaffold1831.1/size99527/5